MTIERNTTNNRNGLFDWRSCEVCGAPVDLDADVCPRCGDVLK